MQLHVKEDPCAVVDSEFYSRLSILSLVIVSPQPQQHLRGWCRSKTTLRQCRTLRQCFIFGGMSINRRMMKAITVYDCALLNTFYSIMYFEIHPIKY